jgi:chromosome segregation ATPase
MRYIPTNKNPRTALAAKIKALAALDLNAMTEKGGSGKPKTPRQQAMPAFRRNYNVTEGNAKRGSSQDLQVPEWGLGSSGEGPETEESADNNPPKTAPSTLSKMTTFTKKKSMSTSAVTKSDERQEDQQQAPQVNNQTLFRQRKPSRTTKSLESEIAAKANQLQNLKKRLEDNEAMLQAKVGTISGLQKENLKLNDMVNGLDRKHKVSLKDKVKEVMKLKKVVAAFNVEKRSSTEANSGLKKAEAEAQALRTQVTKLAAELHEKNEQLDSSKYKAKIEKLKREILGIQGERKSLLTQIDAMKGALGVQKIRISELEERLRVEVRNHKSDNSDLEAKHKALQTRYSELFKKWQAHRSASEVLQKDVGETAAQLEKIEILTTQLAKEKERSETLTKQLGLVKKEKTVVGNKLKQEKEIHAKTKSEVKKLTAEKAKLEQQLAAEHKVIVDLQLRLQKLEKDGSKLQDLMKELADQKKINEALQRRIREMEARHTVAIRDLRSQNDRKLVEEKSRGDALQKKLDDYIKEMEDMDSKQKGKSESILKEHNDMISNLQAELEKLRLANEKLSAQNSELINEKRTLETRSQAQQLTIAKQSSTIAEQNLTINNLERELSIMKQKLEAALKEIGGLRKQLKESNDRADELKHENCKLTVQLEASNESLKRLTTEMQQLKKQIRDLSAGVSSNNENNSKKDKLIDNLKHQLDVANEKISKLLLQRKKLQTQVGKIEEELKELRGSSEESKKRIIFLNGKIKDLEKSLKAATDANKSIVSDQEDAKQVGKQAIKEAVNAKSETARLKKELKAASIVVEELKARLEEEKVSNVKLVNRIKSLELAMKDLKKILKSKANVCKELDASTKALSDREKEVGDLKKNILKLNGLLKVREKNIKKLEGAKKDTSESDAALMEALEKIEKLEAEIKKLRDQMKRLKTKQTIADGKSKKGNVEYEQKIKDLTDALATAKKESAAHKTAGKEHINRLKKLRSNLKEAETKEKEMSDLLDARDEHIVKCREQIQRLKRIVSTAENSAHKKMKAANESEEDAAKSLEKMKKIASLVKDLDDAIAAEHKGKGYISNVNVLIKTGEMSTHKKQAECQGKKVHNLEQRVSVLMYNVKYCEKQIAKFDDKIAKKQVAARKDALAKLEKKFVDEAKKAKRFKETSSQNVDELKALIPGAKEKLIKATKERKSIVSDILTLIGGM